MCLDQMDDTGLGISLPKRKEKKTQREFFQIQNAKEEHISQGVETSFLEYLFVLFILKQQTSSRRKEVKILFLYRELKIKIKKRKRKEKRRKKKVESDMSIFGDEDGDNLELVESDCYVVLNTKHIVWFMINCTINKGAPLKLSHAVEREKQRERDKKNEKPRTTAARK